MTGDSKAENACVKISDTNSVDTSSIEHSESDD